MCVAIPVLIDSIGHRQGPSLPAFGVTADGMRLNVDLVMVPDTQVGDYVIAHSGYAISRLTTAEAAQTLDLVRKLPDRSGWKRLRNSA